jgi:RAV-like factor
VWLSTFIGDDGAAHAYNVAAQRFRGHDGITNFCLLTKSSPASATELRFLASWTMAEVVDMLHKHTYPDELAKG